MDLSDTVASISKSRNRKSLSLVHYSFYHLILIEETSKTNINIIMSFYYTLYKADYMYTLYK